MFDQVRKQGFAKVRVDGEVLDITPGMQVDRYKIHDIEVVVDRIKMTEERRERLNASLQTALKMGNGLIMIMENDSDEVSSFSKHLMDPETGTSYEEPSPNSFSFNSPYGACPKCKGLGKINKVDMDKVIPDDTKSINDVWVLRPLGKSRDNMTFKQLRAIAKKYSFTFATPIKEIPPDALEYDITWRQ